MPRVYVYIVRHGETDENVNGIIQGQKDTVLNDTGRAQSKLAGEALREVKFDIALTSDLKRATEVRRLSGPHGLSARLTANSLTTDCQHSPRPIPS